MLPMTVETSIQTRKPGTGRFKERSMLSMRGSPLPVSTSLICSNATMRQQQTIVCL